MKLIKYLLLSLFVASTALAQGGLPIRNDTPTALRDLGSNLQVGRNYAVDQYGRTLIGNVHGAEVEEFWSACSASNTGTSDTAIKAAVAANRIYVTSISCFNTATVASSFEIKDGATVIYAGGISNSTLAGVAYWEHTFGVPLRGTVNTALNFDMATTATATTCCAAGFISVN